MPRKYQSPKPKGEDLLKVFKSITDDTGCYAQQTIKPSSNGGLSIRTVVYREANGVRIGIAQDDRYWRPSGDDLDALLMGALHRVYWLAYELAHQR
jgi:hypothetical protein